jgi:hypothetical protein
MVEQDAILRDTSLRPLGKGLFPGDEDGKFETTGFMESVDEVARVDAMSAFATQDAVGC